MARVVIYDSAMHGSVLYDYQACGSISSVLNSHNISSAHVILNGKVENKHNKILLDNDLITITPIPQGVVAIGLSLLAAGYSYYQASKLSDVGQDTGYEPLELADPERVATMRTASNKSRQGQVWPIRYGKRRITPELAAQPLRLFVDNKENVFYLFTLNRNKCTFDDIRVGDTPISSFKHTGKIFQKGEPVDFFDAQFIECTEVGRGISLDKHDNENIGNTPYSVADVYDMTPFYTVRGEEDFDKFQVTLGGGGFYSTLFDETDGNTARQELMEAYVQWIAYDANDYPIASNTSQVYNSTSFDSSVVINAPTQAEADAYEANYLAANNGWLNPELNQVEQYNTARLRRWIGQTFTVSGASATNEPFTDDDVITDEIYADFDLPLTGNVRRIDFRVATKRKNKDELGDHDREYQERMRLVGARGFFASGVYRSYPNTTYALQIETDGELSAQSQNQINGVMQTILPTWDGVAWTEKPTSNAAWADLDILRMHGGVLDSKIDLDQFLLYAEHCEQYGFEFCGEFLSEIKIGSARQKVHEVSRAVGWQRNGQYTVILDVPNTNDGILFNGINSDIFSAEITIRLPMPQDKQGIQVEFSDFNTNKPRIAKDEREGVQTYDTLRLAQINSERQALRLSRFYTEKKLDRNLSITFTAGFQAQELEPLQPILFAPAIASKGQTTEIIATNGDTLILSQPVTLADGVNNYIYANSQMFAESKQYIVTAGANEYELVAVGHDIVIQSQEYPVVATVATETEQPFKLIVENVRQAGEYQYQVTAFVKTLPSDLTGWGYNWSNNWSG